MDVRHCAEEEIPAELILLWEADMHVTADGDAVTYAARLRDIAKRHGEESSAYRSCADKAEWLKAHALYDPELIFVEDIGLPRRVYDLFKRNGIDTVADMVVLTEKDILSMRNAGEKTAACILEKAREYREKLWACGNGRR